MDEGRKHYHFIGICGTAMGAVAAALREQGHEVTGSDAAVYPPMSTFLESRGIRVIEGYAEGNLPQGADYYVVGNAISRGNPELEALLDRRWPYTSLPEILKQTFLRGKRNLVVTGTHGKTTTSSMLAWVLETAGLAPDFLIGGLPENFGCGARFAGAEHVVLEGDEYDTAFFDKRSKFVHYLPEVVVINNIEFDHADIFDDLAAIQLSFRRMLNIVPRGGKIFANGDERAVLEVIEGAVAPVGTVGFGEGNDLRIRLLEAVPGRSVFSVGGVVYEVPMDGEFNVRNAAMAACAAGFVGVGEAEIRAGLASFGGVARRQQVRGVAGGVTVVDDFGHHPTAIGQALAGMRQRYPGARLWALFEPRSNTSRRKVHEAALGEALAQADGAMIAEVENPGKVCDEERMDPEAVVARIRAGGGEAYAGGDADGIVERLCPLVREGDVVVVFSNGGFGGIHDKLLARLGEVGVAGG
jgi:UDP-N-acetylmuramate: L-alanyl-gamma-D-glutamyl-meso-diaminopimelate ligase